MSVSELFYQSALISALVFLWLASAISAMRILLRNNKRIAISSLLAIFFGPFALMGAWVFDVRKKQEAKLLGRSTVLGMSAFLGIILATVLIAIPFYLFFVLNVQEITLASEILLNRIFLYLVITGFVAGIILSAITRRLAFFETAWTTFFCAFLMVFLKEWADEVFSFGTSFAYFFVLIGTWEAILLLFLTLGGSVGFLLFGEGRFNCHFYYERYIGLRFLMTKRSSQVVSLITIISVLAVMIACGGMIVVMSVMNGFSFDLRSKILGANAHLMVMKYGKDFTESKDIIEKTKDIAGIISASSFVVNEGMVSSNKNLSGAIITGIDLLQVKKSGRLQYVSDKALDYLENPKKIPVLEGYEEKDDLVNGTNGENELPGVIVGKDMATELGVFESDIVNLISPVGEIGPTGPIPKAKPFRVAGLFISGMYEYDAKFVYITLKEAQDFFNLEESISGVEYRVKDIDQTRKIALKVENKIGGYPYYVRDWMQMNRNMFSALQLEKIVMLIILGTVIFMASLLILVTLIMVVMEKGKEIAILKSMGATDVSIMKIFVTYGLFVGGLGAILGGLFGIAMCFLIEKIGIRLDPDIYYFSNIPVKVIFTEVLLIVFGAILISFLATIPPALFAARLKPVEGLRYE